MRRSKRILLIAVATFLIIGIAFLFIFLKPQPTHNPFDSVFNVSINSLKEEGYILEPYQYREPFKGKLANYYKTIPNGRIFYMVHGNEPDIVAKGCEIILDTLCKACANNTSLMKETITMKSGKKANTHGEYKWLSIVDSLTYFSNIINDTLSISNLDTSLINERLKSFGVSLVDTSFRRIYKDTYAFNDIYAFEVKRGRSYSLDSLFHCSIHISNNSIRTIYMITGNPEPYSKKTIVKLFTSLLRKDKE